MLRTFQSHIRAYTTHTLHTLCAQTLHTHTTHCIQTTGTPHAHDVTSVSMTTALSQQSALRGMCLQQGFVY